MNKKTFEQQLKKKEFIWDASWISVTLILLIAMGTLVWMTTTSDTAGQRVLTVFFVLVAFLGVLIGIVGKIDRYLRRTWLKGYCIEAHGDVIKLCGAVRLLDMASARLDVLAVKKGFKIVDEAYDKYGCTIAAVRATGKELQDKEKLKEMGITVSHIYS